MQSAQAAMARTQLVKQSPSIRSSGSSTEQENRTPCLFPVPLQTSTHTQQACVLPRHQATGKAIANADRKDPERVVSQYVNWLTSLKSMLNSDRQVEHKTQLLTL